MRFEVEHAAFKALVEAVAGVAVSRTTIPILTHLLIEAADARLSLTANNLDTCATSTGRAAVSVPGAACVPALDLKAAMNAAPKGALVWCEAADGALTIRAGRWSAILPTLPCEDFPVWPVQGADHEVPGAVAALPFCLPFVSDDETRYYLQGIALREGWAIATSGVRLAAMPCEATPDCPHVILPTEGVKAMLKPLAAGARLFVGPNQWRCEAEGLVLRGKMIEGTFPDWQRVVPRDAPGVATLRAPDLVAAIEAATMGLISTVCLRCGDGRVAVEAVRASPTHDRGAAQSGAAECDAETAGTLVVGFSRSVIVPVIAAFGSETITISASDGMSPLRVDAGDDRVTVAMPMRIYDATSAEAA